MAILLPPSNNLNHQIDLPFTTPSHKHLCGNLTAPSKQPLPSKRTSFHNSIPQTTLWQSNCPHQTTLTIKEIFLSQLHPSNIPVAILLTPTNNLNHQRDLPFTTPSLNHLCGNLTATIKQSYPSKRSSFHNSIYQTSLWQSYCPQQATVTIKEIFLSQLHPSNIFVAILLPTTSNLNHQRDLPFTTPSHKHLCGNLTAPNKQSLPSKRTSFHNSIPQTTL